MARCGCSGQTCNCVVQAGANVTVTGTGAAGDPYIVSANDSAVDVLDSPSINFTLIPGAPDIITGVVLLDPAAGNLITLAAGGLRVDCAAIAAACAIGVAVDDTTTVNMTLGPGNLITSDVKLDSQTPGNLITAVGPNGIASGLRIDCDDIRSCFTAGPGIDPAALLTGQIAVCLSGTGGNALSIDVDGCLFAATGATPTTACGILGTGTLVDPLVANVEPTFPFACGTANGGDVYCDTGTGQLKVDPPHFQTNGALQTPFGGATSPVTALSPAGAPASVVGIPLAFSITNPSPCRTMRVQIKWGLGHMLFGNPPGGGNGTNDIEVNGTLSIAGAATGAIGVTAGGHQHWRMSGLANSDRFIFDTTMALSGSGASVPHNEFTLAPGGVANLVLQGTFQTVASTTAPPANTDGNRWAVEWWGSTLDI